MVASAAPILRTEIQECKKMRHEFVMRKFQIASVFLAGGALRPTLASGVTLDLSFLLYLVPLVAIAFDVYIFTEDYRIKRAGEFLRRGNAGACEHEVSWEEFAKQHPSYWSTAAFFGVTVLFLAGSALILWQLHPLKRVFFLWLGVVLVLDLALVIKAFRLRFRLEEPDRIGPNAHALDVDGLSEGLGI